MVRTAARNRARNPEGGIGITTLTVNTDRPVLEGMQKYFGGTIHDKTMSEYGVRKPYYWMLHGKKAAHFLASIYDYLVIKKDQATAAILFAETYFAGWRHCERAGWPLTPPAIKLRRITFTGFRAAMDAKLGRGISWHI